MDPFQDKTHSTFVANGGGMASKGLQAIICQGNGSFEAVYKPSHTIEALIGYTACYA